MGGSSTLEEYITWVESTRKCLCYWANKKSQKLLYSRTEGVELRRSIELLGKVAKVITLWVMMVDVECMTFR